MPKKKKKKADRWLMKMQEVRAESAMVYKAITEGANAGQTDGAYQRVLGVSPEAEAHIRSLESNLDGYGLSAFRVLCLKHIPLLLPTRTSNSPVTILEKNQMDVFRSFRCWFIDAAVDIISQGYTEKSTDIASINERLSHFYSEQLPNISQNFLDLNSEYHFRKLEVLPYADYISANILSVVDWNNVISGTNVCVWAKQVLRLVEELTSPDVMDHFKELQEKVLLSLLDIIAELMPSCVTYTSNDYARLGLFDTYSGKPRALDDSDSVDVEARFIASIIADFMVPQFEEALFTKLTSEYASCELAYTMFSLLARCFKYDECPELVDLIYSVYRRSSFSYQPEEALFSDEDLNRSIHLDTDKLFSYESLAAESNSSVEEANEEPVSATTVESQHSLINIKQLMYDNAFAIVPSKMSISLKWVPTLTKAGYTDEEAAAVSGFMEGWHLARTVLSAEARNFSESMDAEQRKRIIESDAKQGAELIRQSVMEYSKNQMELISNAYKELDESKLRHITEKNQFARQRRKIEYRADTAEKKLDEASDEIDRLRAENRMLNSMVSELQHAILEVTDHPDEDVQNIKTQFPSDIGRTARITVFGGTDNWVAEMRSRFPKVNFYGINVQPDEFAIRNSDIVILNTFAMKHSQYWLIGDTAKKGQIPVHYFTSKGINKCSLQLMEIHETLKTSDSEG